MTISCWPMRRETSRPTRCSADWRTTAYWLLWRSSSGGFLEGEDGVAEAHDGLLADGGHLGLFGLDDLDDAGEGDGVDLVADADHHGVHDGDGEGDFDGDGAALAGLAEEVDGALDLFDVGFDDVHADAAA
jgi:hypothetical protein